MSALAQAVIARGDAVTGSDRDNDAGKDLEVIRKLRAGGVQFRRQDGSGVSEKTSGVVVSTAIEKDNPDILAANRLRVPIIHRSEMLSQLVKDKKCAAVTGTSGKSTVTGMIGWILERLGADPSVVNGAPVLNWCDEKRIGNMRPGLSDLWVIEADESDKSLLNYHPDWAVITNVTKDHFSLGETVDLFKKFESNVKKGVVCLARDPALARSFKPQLSVDGSSFVYNGNEIVVPVPGRHNAENALHAVMLCERLGYEIGRIRRALMSFKGIQRRLERIGDARGILVIDDYAHNPAKIKATWQALAPSHGTIIGVWRPHGYKPLAAMMDELVSVFCDICRPADKLLVLPVYDAGGTADRSVKSEMLVDTLKKKGLPVSHVGDADAVVKQVERIAKHGDVVVTMGARDPQLSDLARRILQSIRDRQ